jgi:hypothetical protein
MLIKVKNTQNIFDVSIIHQGSIEAVFEISRNNNVSVSDIIEPGTELEVPDVPRNKAVVEYYKNNEIESATGGNEEYAIVTAGNDGAFAIANIEDMYIITNNGNNGR